MLSRRRSGYLRCCGIKLIMPSGIRHVAGQRGSQGPRMQSPSAVVLEPRKIKSDTVSTVSPSISHEVVEPDAMIFVFFEC